MPRWVLGVVIGPWLLASPLRAQGTSVREHHLTVAGGPLFVSQRDANASPLRYGGTAGAFQAGYGVRTGGTWLAISLGGALGKLRSDLTQGNVPRQEAWRGWVETEYARVMIATPSRTRWLLGARFAAHGTAIHHYYADPGASSAGYTFFSAAIGPIVGVERALGRRSTVSAWAGAPLLALIARPYVGGNFLSRGGALHVRVAALDVFQGPQLTAAYATELGHGADLVVGYHVVVERYRDSLPFRYASQDVSVALRLRLGGTL